MSKGYAVYPLMTQPRENVIDEKLIRDCIYLAPAATTDEERLRVVGNREEAVLKEKMRHEVENVGFHRVDTLLISFRQIGRIENLYGLKNLTKLCLDNNHIEKVENLEHLTCLKWLDLSFNRIKVIEGLEGLTELENVSFFSNQITAVSGLDHLKKLTTLSLGGNCIENLDETARYLHYCRALQVLVLKGCRIDSMPHYRARVLAFVPRLRFLDGRAVKPEEKTRARDEQRENLLSVDEDDERIAAEEKAAAEAEGVRREYERLNCPDETKLCDELFQLQSDGRDMLALLRCEAVISASKELLDRFQNDFNEKTKELADAMKAISARREQDDEAYRSARQIYNARNTAESKALIKAFEKKLKAHVPKGLGRREKEGLSYEAADSLQQDLLALQSDLVEKEADQYDAFEALNNGTLGKWKSDAVDVLLQSSFENLSKIEGDFQASLRHAFDALFEQRQRREHAQDEYYYAGKVDESTEALLSNREEYQKLLGEWGELRRKRLEELELLHLKVEERTLAERAHDIVEQEQTRHRARLNEVAEYVEHMTNHIDSCVAN